MAEQYKKDFRLIAIGSLQHETLSKTAKAHSLSIRSLADYVLAEAFSDEERANEIGQVLASRKSKIAIDAALLKTKVLIEEEKRKAQLRLEALEARQAELRAKSTERLETGL